MSLSWSISIKTSGVLPPVIFAAATPSAFSISFFMSLLTTRRSSCGDVLSAVTFNTRSGISNGLNFITIGSSDPRGRLSFIRSIFSLTPNAAKSILVPQLNSATTRDVSSFDIELIRRTPLTVPTASSTGFVTKISISSGAASL